MPKEVSPDIIGAVAMKSAKTKVIFTKIVKHLPGVFRFFWVFSPRILKRDFAEARFEVEWVEDSQNRVAFNIKKCHSVNLFRKYRCLEIGPLPYRRLLVRATCADDPLEADGNSR